ncbi:hypothetical protein KOR42_28620 [Thalassoglobus neptunius]|uniref:Uncharacterized protein n=1 Tax=Thalassoglobus neptunius TaxID=1938619 RepID=A0A5C5WXM3_9PLAN|nr:hypothetical protein [Thalassoglobus neptunius]TWT55476.1 hypothetical protein KOR42_28620 [Thalassoglobus neptunius]
MKIVVYCRRSQKVQSGLNQQLAETESAVERVGGTVKAVAVEQNRIDSTLDISDEEGE